MRNLPNLRLRRDTEDTDIIPFPTAVTGWQPRPLWEKPKHDTEAALEQVELHLNRLSGLLDGDDDRPSAA